MFRVNQLQAEKGGALIEGKKYYLLNLPEEERATDAIARLLRYGAPGSADAAADVEADASSGGGSEDVEVEDVNTPDSEEVNKNINVKKYVEGPPFEICVL